MDPLASAAAHALSVFDPLAALKRVALRNDAPALAMRGIAMAQLGEFTRARALLRRAARAFGSANPLSRARCIAAEAEVALVCRDLGAAGRGLEAAAEVLLRHGDSENALFVRLQLVRRLVLLGRVSEAARSLSSLDLRGAPARMVALAGLVGADIAVRRVRPREARIALEHARAAARIVAIPSLTAEIDEAVHHLAAPVARLCVAGTERPIDLDEVEAIGRSRNLVVDACRMEVRAGGVCVRLATRPVLFALAVALGEAAPGDVEREALARRPFFARRLSDSVRARLRVEIGRLRRALASIATVRATPLGFSLAALSAGRVLVLLPPTAGEASALLALIEGGESWSTSALAAALGRSQRTLQRSLAALRAEGRVQAVGRGRARRWAAPAPIGFATTLLLAVGRRDV